VTGRPTRYSHRTQIETTGYPCASRTPTNSEPPEATSGSTEAAMSDKPTAAVPHAECSECGLLWWTEQRYQEHVEEDHA